MLFTIFIVSIFSNLVSKRGLNMLNQPFSFDHTMRELFEYPDPSMHFVVWTGDFHILADHNLVCHWHNEFEYGILLSGTLDYYIDGKHIRLKQGDAVFINANSMHTATQVGNVNAVMVTVSFLPSLFVSSNNSTIFQKYFQPLLQSSIKGFFIERKTDEGINIVKLLYEIYNLDAKQTDDCEMLCISLISHIWVLTLRYIKKYKHEFLSFHTKHKNDRKAKDIVTYIHKHYAEDISIKDIARHTCISRSECFRSFQRYTNKSPVAYLTEYRLSHAVNLLMETDKSVTLIASECGFSNSSYFSKIFKNKYGIPPLQFRKSLSTVGSKKKSK